MYPQDNQIVIAQMSNGWMVKLPTQPFHPSFYQEPNFASDMEAPAVVRRKRPEPPTEKVKISDMKTEHIHVFKTFDEVLAFLKDNIDTIAPERNGGEFGALGVMA